jgi:hypothetical protein
MKRVIGFIAALTLALLINISPTEARIGDHFAETARQTFFKNFESVALDSGGAASQGYVVYRSKQPELQRVMGVALKLDRQGEIEPMEFAIDREFMEQEEALVRSMVLNFIDASVPADDQMSVMDLSNEIEYPQDKGIFYDSIPELPESPSVCYRAFEGKERYCEQRLPHSVVRIQHSQPGNKGWMKVIVIKRRPSTEPMSMR